VTFDSFQLSRVLAVEVEATAQLLSSGDEAVNGGSPILPL